MDAWGPANWALMIPITLIVGAFAYMIVLTVTKARLRELEIRQRIAMVERGLVPPPEADPRAFEQAMNVLDRAGRRDDGCLRASRHRRAGVTLMGIGFGLMLLISIAGDSPHAGIGVGGALVMLGLAFVANSWFERHEPSAPTMNGATVPPTSPPSSRSE